MQQTAHTGSGCASRPASGGAQQIPTETHRLRKERAITHKQRILEMLTRAYRNRQAFEPATNGVFTGGICATVFLAEYMPTYSQRIGELKREGYPIQTRPCTRRHHKHVSRQIEYYIEALP